MNKNRKALTTAALIAGTAGCQLAALADETNESSIRVDYIYVDSPNGKFGEYNGLDDDHSNAALRLNWLGRSKESPEQYWDLKAYNLGLDTFNVYGDFGKQGNYRVRIGYDQLQISRFYLSHSV